MVCCLIQCSDNFTFYLYHMNPWPGSIFRQQGTQPTHKDNLKDMMTRTLANVYCCFRETASIFMLHSSLVFITWTIYALRHAIKFLGDCSRSHCGYLLRPSPFERHKSHTANLIFASNYIRAVTTLPTVRTGHLMDCQQTPPKLESQNHTPHQYSDYSRRLWDLIMETQNS
jgi:hypothetical protein